MKTKLFLIIGILHFCFLSAFTVNGVNFNITSGSSVEVASTQCYVGALVLPSTVVDNGITYNVTSVGFSAFSGCATLTSVVIPNSVVTIQSNAFSDCLALTSVTLPNSLTLIQNAAFRNCSSLTSIILPNSITVIQNATFYGCSSLSSVTIPNSITSINGSAFEGCTSLASISIPNSVTNISFYGFRNCTSLTSINLPNALTSIAEETFKGCTSLETVVIPASVASIKSHAFYGCTSLTSVTSKRVNPLVIISTVFFNVNQPFCTLYVPPGSEAAYEAAAFWTNFAPILPIATLSSDEFNVKNKFSVYPNPAKDKIYFENINNISKINIYDASGKLVKSETPKNNSLDISSLKIGNYFLEIKTDKKTIKSQIIKN